MNYREFVGRATLDIMCASISSNNPEKLSSSVALMAAVGIAATLENSGLASWKKGLKDNEETKVFVQEYMKKHEDINKKEEINDEIPDEEPSEFFQTKDAVLFKGQVRGSDMPTPEKDKD